MNTLNCKPCFEYLEKVKDCIFNEDSSYLYPSNWNICWCYPTRENSITELSEIKKEIELIKEFNGYNLNPLCKTGTDDIIENKGEDYIIDEDIRNSIINLKTDLKRLNIKLNEIESTVKNGSGSDAFCMVVVD